MSGCHHPVLIDQRSSAKVEAVGLLRENDRVTSVKEHKKKTKVKIFLWERTHLQRHLPGPGMRHGLLTVDDAGVATHFGGDGGGAAA